MQRKTHSVSHQRQENTKSAVGTDLRKWSRKHFTSWLPPMLTEETALLLATRDWMIHSHIHHHQFLMPAIWRRWRVQQFLQRRNTADAVTRVPWQNLRHMSEIWFFEVVCFEPGPEWVQVGYRLYGCWNVVPAPRSGMNGYEWMTSIVLDPLSCPLLNVRPIDSILLAIHRSHGLLFVSF